MAEPARCILIDATEPKAAVADQIWTTVSERLSPATAPLLLTEPRRERGCRNGRLGSPCSRAQRACSSVMRRRRPCCWIPIAAAAWRMRGCLPGPAGIGKATLAYRMARFILAHPNRSQLPPYTATSLHVPMEHIRLPGAWRRKLIRICWSSSARSTKKPENSARKFKSTTCAGAVRFFGSTAAEGGWRVAIVDAVDELNEEGANALLKVLEEPPETSASAACQPSGRGFCRPSAPAAVCLACGRLRPLMWRVPRQPPLGEMPMMPSVAAAAAAAEGSVRRALALLDPDALDLRKRIMALLDRPAGARSPCTACDRRSACRHRTGSPRGVCGHGECVARSPSRVPAAGSRAARSNCRHMGEIQPSGTRCRHFNLDRKPLVFNIFGWLAEASRG